MLLQDSSCKAQSTLHSLWSPSKPRSPLSENSSCVIQEGNGLENTDAAKPKKGREFIEWLMTLVHSITSANFGFLFFFLLALSDL